MSTTLSTFGAPVGGAAAGAPATGRAHGAAGASLAPAAAVRLQGAVLGRLAPEGEQPGPHPALWRAHELAYASGGEDGPTVATGHAELDAQLPGGGWPARLLTELLLPHAGVGELRLLAPALVALQRNQRSLMWFDPPIEPCAWALLALGLNLQQLVVVRPRPASLQLCRPRQMIKGQARSPVPAADILWALEQALKSGHLGATVAWLPARLPADALRRLQLAAQAHNGPVFLLRDAQERLHPSAAPLRLLLASAGANRLRVTLLKRRGPPLANSLTLTLSSHALLKVKMLQCVQAEREAKAAKALLPHLLPANPTVEVKDANETNAFWTISGLTNLGFSKPRLLKLIQADFEVLQI